MKQNLMKGANEMRREYDFSKSVRNPYIKKLKKQITIRLETETIDYFKKIAAETDIPYQKLMNLFLKNCAQNKIKPSINWKSS
jgi:predicted DNA binding CopG/RHH family protein